MNIPRDSQGLYHSDDDAIKPTVIDEEGNQYWFQHGELHRTGDRPAIIFHNGTIVYAMYGDFHRDHGRPAIITRDQKIKLHYKHGVKWV